MALVVGLDWGGATHAVCVLERESGAVVDRFEARHDAAGLKELARRLARRGAPADLPIALERPSGLIVDVLIAAGHPVVPIHPNAVKASRPRYRSGVQVETSTPVADLDDDDLERICASFDAHIQANVDFDIVNYARKINKLFTQHKPHDDRHPEEGRRDALYSSFFILKSLMIMLYPFVPTTMDRLRQSLALPESVFSLDQLGTPIPAGHRIGAMGTFFPAVAGADADAEK